MTMLGLAGAVRGEIRVFSYEGPFGVGYCSALWEPSDAGASHEGAPHGDSAHGEASDGEAPEDLIISCWVVFNAICVAFGLNKGIKIASDIRSYLMIIMLAWVVIIGASTFTINYFTDSVGQMFNNLGRMLFNTDAIGQGGFPQSWTVFYWAWWVVYGIQMCIFLARSLDRKSVV